MQYCVEIPFERSEWAHMVYNTLAVDTELKEDLVQRHYEIANERVFIARFSSNSAKMLRTSVSSFYDMLLLACKTIEQFGQ